MEYASEELLQKFRELGAFAPWQKEIVLEVLGTQGVEKVSGLHHTVAQALYETINKTEIGIMVQSIPNTANYESMSDRNKRRLINSKSKMTGIRNMSLDEFQRMTVTDQFVFLKERLPDGHFPIDIKAWRE